MQWPLASIVGREGLEDRKNIEIGIFRRVPLQRNASEDGLTALSHLPDYPTCPKAMCWIGIQRCMYLTRFIEQVIKDSSVSRKGLHFFVHRMMIRCPVRVHPFCPSGGLLEGRRFPPSCLGLPGAFHCVVLLYDACQIYKVQYAVAVEGVKDSLVRTVVAKY